MIKTIEIFFGTPVSEFHMHFDLNKELEIDLQNPRLES